MPTFEVTAPDGKTYDVQAPEGATQEQALEHFKAEWPKMQQQQQGQQAPTEQKPPEASSGPSKGVTAMKGAVGGYAGAVAMPWLMRGAGVAISAMGFPEVGVPVVMAGNALQAEQYASTGAALATTLGSAAVGAVTAPAGQVAEEAAVDRGVSPTKAKLIGGATEMGLGMGLGAAAGATKALVMDLAPKPVKFLLDAYHNFTNRAVEGVTDGAEAVSKAVASARAALQSPDLKEQPQHVVWDLLHKAQEKHTQLAERVATGIESDARAKAQNILQQGRQRADAATTQGLERQARARQEGQSVVEQLRAQGKTKAAQAVEDHEKEAARILAEHKAQAQKVIEDAAAEAAKHRQDAALRAQVLEKASQGKAKTAATVQKLSAPKLAELGEAKAPEDIGKPLAERIGTQKAAQDEQLRATDATLRAERDKIVADKEAKGEFIDEVPEYKELRAEIAAKIQKTPAGREASRVTLPSGEKVGLTRATEQGVTSAYEKIWQAISSKRVQTGANEDGSPKYEIFRTTNEALDHVRRKLGDAAYGKEAEGYAGLGQDLARKMYERISSVQKKYVGEAQDRLQANYTQQLAEGQKFKTRMARMTQDEEKSPAGIPNAFFKTRDGVQDLKELTGSPELVERAAKDFVAGKLQGRSAAQVQEWLAKPENKGWLDELPEVKKGAEKYLADLTDAEALAARRTAVAGKLEKRSAEQAKKAEAVRGMGEKEAGKTMTEAQRKAQKLEAEARQLAQRKVAEGKQTAKAEQKPFEEKAKAVTTETKQKVGELKQQTSREARDAMKPAAKAAGEVTKEAKAAAAQVRKEAYAKLEEMSKKGTTVEYVEGLINKEPDMQKLMETGKALHGMPGGQKAWEDSVTRVVVKKSPRQLENWWETRGREVAKAGGASDKAIAKLDAGVQEILRAANPKAVEQIKKRVAKAFLESIGASMGATVSRAVPPYGDSE